MQQASDCESCSKQVIASKGNWTSSWRRRMRWCGRAVRQRRQQQHQQRQGLHLRQQLVRVSVPLSIQIQRAANQCVVLGVTAQHQRHCLLLVKLHAGGARDDADAVCHLLHAHLAVARQEVGALGAAHLLPALRVELGFLLLAERRHLSTKSHAAHSRMNTRRAAQHGGSLHTGACRASEANGTMKFMRRTLPLPLFSALTVVCSCLGSDFLGSSAFCNTR